MIFLDRDKAWCLFPRGAQRLIFLFFQINTVLPTYCLSLALSTITPSPSPRLGYCLPAGQGRREPGSAADSSVPAPHTDCVYLVNMKCFTVCALVRLSL